MRDKTRYGDLLRYAYNQGLTGVNQWQPVFNTQKQNSHTYWSLEHKGRQWIEDKADIMNELIKLRGYQRYLEIGGQPMAGKTSTYHKVNCKYKDSVDSFLIDESSLKLEEDCRHFMMTSDEYFETVQNDHKFDIVFIDAWHEHDQVSRDISNSLELLSDNGIIVLHDMIPLTSDLEKDFKRTGTCWRAFADLRKRKDLKMDVLVPPWGTEDSLGLIQFGNQTVFEKDIEYSYEFLLENVEELMSLIDLDVFYEEYILKN